MIHVLPVILVIALIRELKYISPLSTIANISSFIALSLILYNSVIGLGPISDRKYVGYWDEIPLSFGVMVFALEGITLVNMNVKLELVFVPAACSSITHFT